MAEMHAWVQAVVGELFDNRDGRLLAFEAALVQAGKDGVARLEVGEDVWAITLHNGSAYELTRSLEQLHARVAPEIEWIPQLGLSRNHPPATLERRLSPFLELDFYQTLDLYGDEFAQPIGAFKSLFRLAKDAGLRVKAHVGEWGTADDVWRASNSWNSPRCSTESPRPPRRQ